MPIGFIDATVSYRLESAEWLPSLDLIARLAAEHPELAAESRQVGGGWLMYAGPQSPLNHIIGLGLCGPVSKEQVDEVEDFYRQRRSICEVVVSPYADMSLMQHLGARGYRVTEWNTVLTRELDSDQKLGVNREVTVRAVSLEEARLWSETVARGFAVPGVAPEFFVPFATARNAICFLAYVNGRPVGGAGGSAFPEEDKGRIAALYGASTLPEFRNRGVQNALLQARLRAAAELGCELAIVVTQPGTSSQRNAERNGFQVAYTKVAMQRAV